MGSRSMAWVFALSALLPLCHADASIYSDAIVCAKQVGLASFKRSKAPQKVEELLTVAQQAYVEAKRICKPPDLPDPHHSSNLAGGVSDAAEELFPVQALIERADPELLARALLYCHFLHYSRRVPDFFSVKFSRGDLRLMKQTIAQTDAGWFDRWRRASGA